MSQAQLIVRTGPMFSEKTEGVITYLRKAKHTGKKILVVTPKKDTREERNITTRLEKDWELGSYDKISIHSITTHAELKDLFETNKPNIIAVDEIHLFGKWLPLAIKDLLDIHDSKDFVVITAGLDMDYLGEIFELTAQLMGMATRVYKETTTCFKCRKEPATMTYKIPEAIQQNENRIDVGGKDKYQARCRSCHKLPE